MNVSTETLDLVKSALSAPSAIAKAITTATGLVAYDLQAPALKLYPVITPLRNSIPRVPGNGGTATNWKAITGVNTARLSPGVSEGNRGGVITTTVSDQLASYKAIGLEDYVTFEADYAAQGFDDAKARAVEGLLRALMIAEEMVILGGNGSLALGQTPTPTLAAVAGGGSLSNAAYNVYCVALTLEGYMNASVAGGVPTTIARTNADGTQDVYGGGAAQISAAASVTPAANGSIKASIAAVKGAFAYAWFWGTGGAANEKLGAVTTINSVLITANAAGSQLAGAAGLGSDNSVNALLFDGLLTQVCTAGSNSYYKALAVGAEGTGTPLTSDNAGGIVEIDEAFRAFWDNYRLSPTELLVSAQELINITKKVIAGGGAPLFRFNMDANSQNVVVAAGAIVGSYLNKFTMAGGQTVPVRLHPNVPPGTIVFKTDCLPYPLSNVSNVVQIKTRREYYQLEWPLKTRKYEYGVYVDEVLQNYFPPAFGVITNIGNG